MKYTLQFIGSGSGLCSPQENYHSNALLYAVEDGKKVGSLCIDCGSTFQPAIESLGIDVRDIGSFYITHLHADHVGGLEWVGFKRFFSSYPFGQFKPLLFGNTELLDDLWKQTLSGGMESLQGQKNKLSTYFEVKCVPPNGAFLWRELKCSLIQTVHVVDNRRIKPSFGLMIELPEGKKIFFTGDTQFAPSQIMTYYEQADEIFQDCELAVYPNSVHAQYHQLLTLPETIKNKMWLYHYSGDIPKEYAGFLGFVKRGQIFDL